MKLSQILGKDKITLSFEVFPPKTEANYEAVKKAALDVAALNPSYMSVTYGAGGSTRANTVQIASAIQQQYGITAISHLTCVGATKEDIDHTLDSMKEAGIENVLALRGDRPKDFEGEPFTDFHYASELVEHIKARGDFCVGGACYPEGHVDAHNKKEDITYLKKKVDAGCDYLTTQMFFDNDLFYNFLYRIREAGIAVPVVAGIMPVTNAKQMKRILSMSGTVLPTRFKMLLDRFGDDPAAMKQAGVAYAVSQIIDLVANGIHAIHIYSMNKPDVAEQIKSSLSEILV